MLPKYFRKARVQIEDIVWHKDLRASSQIVLSVVNRRRIPLPSAIYDFFNKTGGVSNDMGDENFLAEFMIPEPDKCFVDVGASIGGWTFFVAQKGNEVYAFEPSPKSYNVLIERVKKYPNVHPYPYALGDKDTIGRLGLAAFSLSGTMDKEINGLPRGGTIDITIHKLDSLRLPKVGVIKIDTEGYETPILQGAKETIQNYKPRLIIEVHKETGKASETFSEEVQKIQSILKDFGYTWIVRYRQISLREIQPFIIANPTAKKNR